MTLSRATNPGMFGLGTSGNEGVLKFPKDPASLEPYRQIISCNIPNTRLGKLTPLQRCNRVILQTQPAGPKMLRK